MPALDPRTNELWSEFQFLQGIRADLGAIREALDITDPAEVNLCDNPLLVTDAEGWTFDSATTMSGNRINLSFDYPNNPDYQQFHPLREYLAIGAYRLVSGVQNSCKAYLPWVDVSPGQVITFSVDSRNPAGGIGTGVLDALLYDGSTYVGQGIKTAEVVAQYRSPHWDDWYRSAIVVEIPSGVDRVHPRFIADGLGEDNTYLTNARYIEGGPLPTTDLVWEIVGAPTT